MKKVLSMICAVAICLGMAGCGGNKPVGDDPTAVYLDGEKVISLGMTRDEVNAILEPFDEKEDIISEKSVTYKNVISVSYDKKDLVYSIVLSDYIGTEEEKYTDFLGISLGMDYDKAKKMLDKKFIIEDEEREMFWIEFDEEGNLIANDDKTLWTFTISYHKNESNKIKFIECLTL